MTGIQSVVNDAGSPLGKFEHNPSTKQAVLNTVLRGGTSLRTPMPGAFGGVSGAVATVIRRDKPGATATLAPHIIRTITTAQTLRCGKWDMLGNTCAADHLRGRDRP